LSNDFPILNYEKVIKKITRFISDKVRTRKNNNIGGNCGIIIIIWLVYTFMSNSESNFERQIKEGCYMIDSKWICPKS